MRRAGNLFEQIISFENLHAAARDACRGKKGKNNVARFYFNLESELIRLEEDLRGGKYQPSPYGVFKIFEPKEREICMSSVRDRVVHHAICRILEPIFEKRFIYDTYACRVGKGTHRAVQCACRCIRRVEGGYFLKCDIRKYFYSIDHAVLKRLLGRLIKDSALLNLLSTIIDHEVPGRPSGKGLPIGNLTSQYFANLYLGELDHLLKDRIGVRSYLRYMDDFVLFSTGKDDLRNLLSIIENFLGAHLLLELKEAATKLAPVSEGVPFLGFRIFPQLIRLQRPNLVRLRRRVQAKERKYAAGEITAEKMAQSVASMVAHASHANTRSLRRKMFEVSMQFG